MKRVKQLASVSLQKVPLKKEMEAEDLWKMQIERIRQMRSNGGAPVDTMGCHMLADPLASEKDQRFQVLLALMLSSQTKDEITAGAMHRLKQYGCNVEQIVKIPTSELEQLIYPVGFYKRKAVFIQKAAIILRDNYDGDVPDTLEQLCALPGVGPKMSNLVLQIAWGKCVGIAVDTHVHRIVNRLGWMNTKTPEQTREKLQNLLPQSEWQKINPLLVGFGQTICLPIKPKCAQCTCRHICPASTAQKVPLSDFEISVSSEVKVEIKEESPVEVDMKRESNEVKNEIKTEIKEEPVDVEDTVPEAVQPRLRRGRNRLTVKDSKENRIKIEVGDQSED